MTKLYKNSRDIKYNRNISERILFPFPQLNYKTGGMAISGGLTIITSGSDNGKSTFTMQTAADAIKQGYKVLAVFGEHSEESAIDILYKQITPFSQDWNIEKYKTKKGRITNIGTNFISNKEEKTARELYDNNLFIYNIENSLNIMNILKAFKDAKEQNGCSLFILDNIMQIDLETHDTNREFTDLTEKLRLFSLRNKIHIILVAHMKKKSERDLVRFDLDDIAGTSNLPNKALTVLSLTRLDKVNKDSRHYKNLATRLSSVENIDIEQCDNLIEILKCKWNGLGFIGLKYNKYTKCYEQVAEMSSEEKTVVENVKMVQQDLLTKPDDLRDIF